jgi:hypothetical protein
VLIAQETQVRYRTPIIDLLWGPADFDIEARPTVVHTIMNSMNQRVTAQVLIYMILPVCMLIISSLLAFNCLMEPPRSLQRQP